VVSTVIGAVPAAIPEPFLRAQSVPGKFFLMFFAIFFFALVFGLVLFLASLFKGKNGERVQGALFVGPAVVLLAIGLMYPAILTINQSLRGRSGEGGLTLSNYSAMFTQPELLLVLRNTALWVILVPILATSIGLIYAILIDRARGEAFAKALIFLPMAISMVGAGIIWKFVYQYKQTSRPQIGLLNAILKLLRVRDPAVPHQRAAQHLHVDHRHGVDPGRVRDDGPLRRHQGHPRRDHRGRQARRRQAFKMFRYITLPSIRPALVVVVTTIGIGTLKVFDIVRTMTGGQFDTSVVANEFYSQSFRFNAPGLGAALAVLLFILVIPIVTYNIIQMRKEA
jgi:alpha-glucoside transport system permease protein